MSLLPSGCIKTEPIVKLENKLNPHRAPSRGCWWQVIINFSQFILVINSIFGILYIMRCKARTYENKNVGFPEIHNITRYKHVILQRLLN